MILIQYKPVWMDISSKDSVGQWKKPASTLNSANNRSQTNHNAGHLFQSHSTVSPEWNFNFKSCLRRSLPFERGVCNLSTTVEERSPLLTFGQRWSHILDSSSLSRVFVRRWFFFPYDGIFWIPVPFTMSRALGFGACIIQTLANTVICHLFLDWNFDWNRTT